MTFCNPFPMDHTHSHPPPHASPRVRRRLAVALAPFVLATVVALVALWPSRTTPANLGAAQPAEEHEATVVRVREGGCPTPPGVRGATCSVVEFRVEGGPDSGETLSFNATSGPNQEGFEPGDRIVVARAPDAPADQRYYFVDHQRSAPLIALAVLFVAVVVALSRWRGVASLAGLGISLLVLAFFVIPAILDGSSPVAVALAGSAAVMFVALYLSHGFNVRTTSAVLGTLASLALTGLLAATFVEVAQLTGFASEEAGFLQVSAGQVNLQGLLLGGIIIGTLGVLDDVTVTQASAVWELHLANPGYGLRELYRAAVRIGRDHIASTVNTLVLAYAGASLPLLLLFTLSERSLSSVVRSEIIAVEVVRTLVGSIGLVASVPITTALTAWVVAARDDRGANGDRTRRRRRPEREVEAPARTKFEREWFGEPTADEPRSGRQ